MWKTKWWGIVCGVFIIYWDNFYLTLCYSFSLRYRLGCTTFPSLTLESALLKPQTPTHPGMRESILIFLSAMNQIFPSLARLVALVNVPETSDERLDMEYCLQKKRLNIRITIKKNRKAMMLYETIWKSQKRQRLNTVERALNLIMSLFLYLMLQVWNTETTTWPDFTHPLAAYYWGRQMLRFHNQVPIDGAWIVSHLLCFCFDFILPDFSSSVASFYPIHLYFLKQTVLCCCNQNFETLPSGDPVPQQNSIFLFDGPL